MEPPATGDVDVSRPALAGLPLRVLVVLGLVATTVVAFHADFAALAASWNSSPNESHGFLVALAIPVLLWLRRARLGAGRGLEGPAIAVSICIAIAYAMARAAALDLAAWTLLPLLAWASVWVALGRVAARGVAVPLAMFWLAVPVWSTLIPALQALTIVASTFLLSLLGVPAFVDGALVTVPAGVFEIADGCSGKNYFVVALTIASLIAVLQELPPRRALLLIAAAVGAAMVMNWLRVTALIVIGHVTAMQSPLVADHIWFGWWLFAATLVPILWFARRLIAASPVAVETTPVGAAHAWSPLAAGVAAATLVATGAWGAIAQRGDAAPLPALTLPAVPGWAGPGVEGGAWQPEFPGAALSTAAAYANATGRVDAYVAHFRAQAPARRLVGLPANVAGAGWRTDGPVRSRVVSTTGDGVLEQELRTADGARRLVWYWYEVRGERAASASSARLRLAGAAAGLAQRSGVVALSTACDRDCDGARQRLGAALRAGLAGVSAQTAG